MKSLMFLSLRSSLRLKTTWAISKQLCQCMQRSSARAGAFTYQIPVNVAEEGMALDICKPCLRMAAQAFLWILCTEENISK